jgi:hypothetical protein
MAAIGKMVRWCFGALAGVLSNTPTLDSDDPVRYSQVARLGNAAGHFKQLLRGELIEHRQILSWDGEDMPEIRKLEVGWAG